MINSIIDAIKERKRLPKYLVMIPDKDIIQHDVDFFSEEVPLILNEILRWFVRQIDLIIRRQKIDFLDRKPGSLQGFSPKTIYVCMLCRCGYSEDSSSTVAQILRLRPKFNDALNDAVAKVDQYIMTINSCGSFEHFDKRGNLSKKGKYCFWWELDDLIKRFEKGKVKLLPNPTNHPQKRKSHQQPNRRGHNRY